MHRNGRTENLTQRRKGTIRDSIPADHLEGSRFGTYTATSRYSCQRVIRPKNVAAGGARELPSATQLYGSGLSKPKATSQCIAPGGSREPPVFTHFGRISVETKIAG